MSFFRALILSTKLLCTPLSRLLYRNITCLIDSHLPGGYCQLPLVVSIQPTFRCNQRCKMCNQWGERGNFVGKNQSALRTMLKLDQWKAIIDDIASFRPSVVVWGGEPLLYNGILELIQHITHKGLRCYLSTNGMLLERYSQDLVDSNITAIQVSIDGPKTINDEIRGRQGGFDAAMVGIRKLQKLRDDRALPMVITINTVITARNCGHIVDIIRLAEDSGVDLLTLTLVQFITSDMGREYQREMKATFGCDVQTWKGWINDEINAEADCIINALSKLEETRLKPSLPVVLSPAVPEVTDYFYKPAKTPYKRCYLPYFEANILPDGDVNVCHNIQDFILGNLTTQKFHTLWNNEKARGFRQYLQRNLFSICAKCSCGLQMCPHHRMLRAFKRIR